MTILKANSDCRCTSGIIAVTIKLTLQGRL